MTLRSLSVLSHFAHLIKYASSKPRVPLEDGVLIISVDIDVGSKWVGEKNKGYNDANIHPRLSESTVGMIEEMGFPVLIQLFEELEMTVTFAVRGQLTEKNCYFWELLESSSINHDIGAHGYYHRTFTSLSEYEAENELKMIYSGMKKFNIEPKSFIFPKNKIAHLHLLEKYKYECYRGAAGLRFDCLNITKNNNLYNVHPSFFLGWSTNSAILNKLIDISSKRKLPFHVWFHIHDLGANIALIRKRCNHVLLPFFRYAKKKEREGKLSFETMYSVVKRLKQRVN